MQEGEPRNNRKIIAARVEAGLGFAGAAVSAVAAYSPQNIIERTASFPLSMGRMLQVAQDAGISPQVTLSVLTVFFSAACVDGIRKLRG